MLHFHAPIAFHKYHALGNHYIIIEPSSLNQQKSLTSQQIRRICDPKYGLGSDGILWGPIFEEKKPIRLRIFNPDGSEAEKSGNGIRIFAHFLKDRIFFKKSFKLQTLGGLVTGKFLKQDGSLIQVNMGKASFEASKIPINPSLNQRKKIINSIFPKSPPTAFSKIAGEKNLHITCVSVGNPHCVILMEEISEALTKQLGPLIENHPLFLNRINVQFMKILDKKNIQIEIWERGAGYTLSSGSSSCAAATVAKELSLVNPSLTVHMPGGKIQIEHSPSGELLMAGPVTPIAKGELYPSLFL